MLTIRTRSTVLYMFVAYKRGDHSETIAHHARGTHHVLRNALPDHLFIGRINQKF